MISENCHATENRYKRVENHRMAYTKVSIDLGKSSIKLQAQDEMMEIC